MRQIRIITASALLLCASMAMAQKYVGGDISLLPKYESHNANYMTKEGQPITDMLAWLKAQGWNTVRVRLFADPSKAPDKDKGQGVCQDLAYVKAFGKRIKDAGLNFMLDFHYSDTWADPSKQYIPSSWAIWSWEPSQSVYKYTKESLEELVAAGATPDFIQTGNEISWGMLWGFVTDGKYEEWEQLGGKLEAKSDWTGYTDKHWDNFSDMLKKAGKACREVCPNAKIIIHTEQAANTPLVTDFYQRLGQYGVDYDIIGTSYYPYFHGKMSQLEKTINQWESSFPDKKIMVVETGCAYHWAVGDNDQGYPLSYEGQRKFTADLVAMLKKHANVNGLFWWFPEANEYGLDWSTQRVTDKWYDAGLFDNETGRALPALEELQSFTDGDTGIESVTPDAKSDHYWHTLDGRRFDGKPTKPGLYINGHKKILLK